MFKKWWFLWHSLWNDSILFVSIQITYCNIVKVFKIWYELLAEKNRITWIFLLEYRRLCSFYHWQHPLHPTTGGSHPPSIPRWNGSSWFPSIWWILGFCKVVGQLKHLQILGHSGTTCGSRLYINLRSKFQNRIGSYHLHGNGCPLSVSPLYLSPVVDHRCIYL